MGIRELIDLNRQGADGRGDQFDGSRNSGNAHGVGSGDGNAAGRMRNAKNAEREIGIGERVAFALKERRLKRSRGFGKRVHLSYCGMILPQYA